MRIAYNGYTDKLINQLGTLNGNHVNLQAQLGSGQRITESFEDPFAMGRALETTTEKTRIQTQARNLNRAQLIAEFSSETLEQMKVIADKATVDANNTDGLTSSADYEARGLQANQLIEQALRVANAQVSGDYLFGGANTGEPPFVAERYEAGDYLVDGQGVEIRQLLDAPGAFTPAALDATGAIDIPVGGLSASPIFADDPMQVVFIDTETGFVVDGFSGEAAEPPVHVDTLAGTPPYVVERSGPNMGRLKEWNTTDYSTDAVDSSSAVIGDVVVGEAGANQFIARAATLDPATIEFVNASGELVDAETGEATTQPPTAASTLGGTPSYVIEWTAANTGNLKAWDGTDYSTDAADGAGNVYGEVTIANDGTADFISRTAKVQVGADRVGQVKFIRYTGTSEASDDVNFRVGEGAIISPYSRGAANLDYLEFFNDLVDIRDAYYREELKPADPNLTHTGKAETVTELVPKFTDHQTNVLLGIVEFGALLQGIEVTSSINEARFNELERLISAEIDIDTAETIVKLNRAQTAYEAALNSGSRLLGLSLLDYLR